MSIETRIILARYLYMHISTCISYKMHNIFNLQPCISSYQVIFFVQVHILLYVHLLYDSDMVQVVFMTVLNRSSVTLSMLL